MRDSYQLQGTAARVYEEQKVPAIFAPLARATLKAFQISRQATVLDVACGTGILARTIRELSGPSVRISAVDLNAGMIAAAREISDGFAAPIDWKVADVSNLPFGDGAFDVVMCQQGIQFFPDDAAAVREMRRVLRPDGRLAITVWAGVSPFFRAMADAIGRHVDQESAEQSLAPFSYAGAERLPPILSNAGLSDVRVQEITIDRVIRETSVSIPKEIMGNPVGPTVAARGDAPMRAIVDEIEQACRVFRQGDVLVVPQVAHLLSARA